MGPATTTDDQGVGPEHEHTTDGRRLRTHRNREQVLEAILDLFDEGVLDFDAALLAERAGVSVRSVYRYFEDRDALVLEGVARHADRLTEMLEHQPDPSAGRAARIESFLDHRLAVYPRLEAVIRVARHHASRLPVVAEAISDRRQLGRDRLAATFVTELAGLEASRRRALLGALDVATDFDSWRLLRDEHDMDTAEIQACMTTMVECLLQD